MKSVLLTTIGLSCCVLAVAANVPGGISGKDLYARSRKSLVNTKVRLPLVFEPNVGQAPQSAQFVSRTPNGTMLLSSTAATLLVHGEDKKPRTVTMRLNGSRPGKSEALDLLSSYSSYFIGRNRKDWHPRVPHFAKVRFAEVYPGVDVVYYGNDRRLEYDFVVAPGRDHSAIELAFDGVDDIRVDSSGDLLIETAGKTIRQFKPRVYQWIGGVQHEIKAGYRINPAGRVQFALARYDRARPLVIDPVLQYSTYFGGSGFDLGVETAMDASGSLYVAGQTTSGSFRSSLRDQPQRAGETDAMIAKFNTPGDSLAWVAYFGGARNEIAMAIAADSAGNPVIAGWTESQDLPTRNAYQAENRGGLDTFLAKLNPTGTELTFATYLGGAGTDFGTGLAVDASGSPYVAGWTTSANFPTQRSFHSGPGGGGGDAFVTKFSPAGNSIVYSTYVSASGDEGGTGIAVDSAGAAYVTGSTTSANFPSVRPVQPSNRGGRDVYVFKIAPGGGDLEYSTLIGGTKDDVGYRIAVDASGSALVSGYTQSTDFPVSGGFQATYGGGVTDAFVLKLSPAGSAILYASYLGGTGEESGFGNIAIDAAGSAYLTGFTSSRDFPSRNGFQQAYGGGSHDAFLVRVAPAGNTLLYSSLLGGSQTDNAYGLAVDRTGNVVVSGWTSSPDFPSASSSTLTTGGASVADIFIAHISADTSVNLIGAAPQALTFSGRTGQTDPAAQTVALSSTGAPFTFTSGSSVPWLRVSANQTTTPATLTVTPVASGLAAGTHTGDVTVNAPAAANTPLTIRVTLTLAAVPVITTVTPSPLPRGQDAQITISGTGFVNSSEVFAGTSPLQEQFVNATTLRATVPAALLTGAAPLQLTVRNAEGASSAFAVQVGAQPPAIVSTGVVNAATGLAGFVSPGQLITVVGTDFGPDRVTSNTPDASGQLGTTLADTRVLIDGAAVPIVSVARNQINAIVPSSVADKNNVRVEVEFQGQRSTPVGVGVGPASPGLFTANSSGTGQAAAQNQDSSTNQASNPAERGSVVVLYATGFGLTTPASVDGTIVPASPSLPVPVLPVRVTIGGTPAEVVYAGTAPGLLSSIMQINARIAQDVTPGEAVPVGLSIGSATSRTGVTIAVK